MPTLSSLLGAKVDTTNASFITDGTLDADLLEASGVGAGTYGSSSNTVTFVVDDKGRITSATNTSIAISSDAISGLATSATTDTTDASNITSGTLDADRLATSGVSSGTYGSSSNTVTVVVDDKGRITSITNNSIYVADQDLNTTDDVTFANGTFDQITINNTPTNTTDAATKQYVDTVAAASLHYHTPVRLESPTALNATYDNGTAGVGATLTNAGTQTALVVDGITVNLNDRILVYEQANATHNGIYTATDVGSGSTNWVLTRATDANSYGASSPTGLGQGDAFYVTEGDTGAGELYVMNTEGTITFGTTEITFVQISSAQIYSAGTGLNLNGVQFSLANTNVTADGYGSASAVPVIVVDAQGRITSATNTNIAISSSAVSGLATSATTDTTDASNITSGTIANTLLASTGVTAGVYGDATNVAQFTVDQYGRVTSVANVEVSGGGSSGNTFSTIAVSGESDVVADSSTDTLTLIAGDGVTITTNATADSITISASGGGGGVTTGKAIAMAIVFG